MDYVANIISGIRRNVFINNHVQSVDFLFSEMWTRLICGNVISPTIKFKMGLYYRNKLFLLEYFFFLKGIAYKLTQTGLTKSLETRLMISLARHGPEFAQWCFPFRPFIQTGYVSADKFYPIYEQLRYHCLK